MPTRSERNPAAAPRVDRSMFSSQVDRLVGLGYPALAGLGERAFRDLLEPLRATADGLPSDERPGGASYVVVVTRDLVAPEDTVTLLRRPGVPAAGVVDRNHAPGDLAGYDPVPDCTPPGPAYLLVDVERGEEFCDVRPEDATAVVRSRGRTPLTIDEGIALLTHRPDLLEPNKCFMLAGSRRHDRRVPALWIAGGRVAERGPKLGWCWDGNPHTWLGLASAGRRTT